MRSRMLNREFMASWETDMLHTGCSLHTGSAVALRSVRTGCSLRTGFSLFEGSANLAIIAGLPLRQVE